MGLVRAQRVPEKLGGDVARNVRKGSTIAIVLAAAAALTAGALPASALAVSTDAVPTAVAASDGSSSHAISSSQARALGTPAVAAGSSNAVVARAFALQNARALGIRGELGASTASRSIAGGSVVRFPQRVGGVPVLGGEVVVDVSSSGTVRGALSETLPSTAPSTTPSITADAAAVTARALIARDVKRPVGTLVAAAPTLTIYDPAILGAPGPEGARLVWRTEVTSSVDVGVRRLVLVDAVRGSIALTFDLIDHAKSRTVCDANNVRGVGVPCTTPVRTEGGPASAVGDVELAYSYAGITYDFYASNFGRDSIDGKGLPIVSTVRYCDTDTVNTNCPFDNAFWDGSQMVYGDGFASADDVVAHELTHGVTESTSGLFYFYESGAINESLSDIFGEFVDLTDGVGTDNDTTRWQMGEDLPASVGVIRDMSDPTIFGDPDRTDSPNFTTGTNANGPTDSGGVHQNSGVGNKFAYLITDGDTFNGQTVTGLGIPKAAKIIYAASQLLTSASDYRGFATALTQSCAALVGTAGITSGDCTQVAAAITATTMDVAPPALARPVVPAACAAYPGTTSVAAWSDNFQNPSSGNWSRTTSGSSKRWYYASETSPYPGYVPLYATSGTNNLWADDHATAGSSAITMTASVPVLATSYARFNHAFAFDQDTGGFYDGGVLYYSVSGPSGPWLSAAPLMSGQTYGGTLSTFDGTNPLRGQGAFVGSSKGYTTTQLDLSSLAGKTVTLRFTIATDNSFDSYGWFIDDLVIGNCIGADAAPPTVTVGAMPTVSFKAPVFTAKGTDGTGIVGYVVSKRTATARTGFTAWSSPVTKYGTTLTWADRFKAGVTTCLRIQSKDAAGKLSAAVITCTTTPVDDRSLTRSKGSVWAKGSSASAYAATISTSKKVANSLSLAHVRGTSLVLVVRKGKGAGTVSVWIGTTKVATVKLSAGATVWRVQVPIAKAVSDKTVTVKVVSAGTAGATIDGLAVVRK